MRKLIAQSLTKIARARGYEIVPFWQMAALPLVNHLRDFLNSYEIEIVIDVGANKGQFHDLLREEIGFKGRILSFEPVSRYSQMLRTKSATDKDWQIYDFALGREPGEAKINVTASPGLNSFLAPRKDVVEGFWKEDSITHVETVQIRTLDQVLEEANIDCSTRRVYLKLDTQGFDLEVLKGASRSLAHFRGLQTEASIRPIYEGMPTYNESLSALDELGFDLSGMFPVTHDDALRLIELDFIFVNRLFAGRANSPKSDTDMVS